MGTVKVFCVLFMLHLCFFDSGRSGKILVWPMDFSHWINLKVILDELQLRGHEITILVASPSLLLDHTKIPFNVEVLQLPVTKETLMEEINSFIYETSFELPKLSWWYRYLRIAKIEKSFGSALKRICDSAVMNKELLAKLKAAKFDICFADPLSFCGELVAELLNIPFMYTFRFSIGNFYECSFVESWWRSFSIFHSCILSGFLLGTSMSAVMNKELLAKLKAAKFDICFADPLSFCGELVAELLNIPFMYTFRFSIGNFYVYVMYDVMHFYYLFPEWDEYYSNVLDTKYLGRPTTICEIMGKAEMWLIRTYWDFEFPRPYLPNFEFVGGLHCRPAKSLPEELEEFVQSSGKDGVVVFTLGSMVQNLTEEKANMIASALALMPQKVR
ncbi:PREDICTED: UDP-glucuronosyltransferase 2C1-like [Galeopterus variegatus]|uniref:UDP-glucuronosyltransferase 2C1-like n=1 Tax=Galeopterus variegatus TaxID=482537 RepID=A0ABM0RNT6_GALVR|nr:PREDICTED: UDP-glucuronosyltransferase 2C1-like [Galeopterus variegatus]